MSVLVKGMEMPEKCVACDFYYVDFSDGETSCLATGCGVSINDRRDNSCPLVEIPTPHSDLIDSEDLIFEINHHIYTDYNDYNFVHDCICQAETIVEAEDDDGRTEDP